MGKRQGQRQKKCCVSFAEGSCEHGAYCRSLHSRPAEQPDPSARKPSNIEKTVAELINEDTSGVTLQELCDLEQAKAVLQRELRDSELARATLAQELYECSSKAEKLRLESEGKACDAEQARTKLHAKLQAKIREFERKLCDSEQARAQLQRERDERTSKVEELRLELEAARRVSEKIVSIEAENEELKARLKDALARPSGASSSQLAYQGGFFGAEWCFESAPDQWASLPADSSIELLRRYQDCTKGGEATFCIRSGIEEYIFDLRAMSQTNTRTGKVRAIRCQLHVPSNWTRCRTLESVCQTSCPESFEVSGFQKAQLNGTYVLSNFHTIHGCSVWWHVLGSAVVYKVPKGLGLAILAVGRDYSNTRASMADNGAHKSSATCFRVADLHHSKARWEECIDGVRMESRTVQVVPGPGVTSPLMEVAVDFWDKPQLKAFTALLKGSVAHQTHASSCSKFMDAVRVVRVLRIENWHLWTKYCNHFAQVRRDLSKLGVALKAIEPALPPALHNLPSLCEPPKTQDGEYMLLHGTDYETAVKIALDGFDFRLSKPGFYGKGTYFGSQACKCHQYAKKDPQSHLHTIIFSRVILGDVAYATKVDKECKRPPLREGTSRCCDTVVARPGPMPGHHAGEQTHQEFVIFDKFQAYPEFIVQYYTAPVAPG